MLPQPPAMSESPSKEDTESCSSGSRIPPYPEEEPPPPQQEPPPPPRPHPSSLYQCAGPIPYPYHPPLRSSAATIIQRAIRRLQLSRPSDSDLFSIAHPTAVAIGPYYHRCHGRLLHEMDDAKRAAVEEFCQAAGRPREAVRRDVILPLAPSARRCYDEDAWELLRWPASDRVDDDGLAEILLLDGCFLLQFMVSMCPANPAAPPEADPLMARPEVHTKIDAIARDVLLVENQLPWPVLQALMYLRPGVPVLPFLDLMASAFDIGSGAKPSPALAGAESNHELDPPPPHLFGLFYRRQVGAPRTDSHRIPVLPTLGSTAVELAEMGVKLTASKTNKFGDMSMAKRRPGLGVFAELSLAPLVLNDLTACWLLNMAAYEASVGAAQPDNFAVSSYITLIALLINREDDVRELRAKGIINSAKSDEETLAFFKRAAQHLRIGHRYYDIFQRLHEYKQERRMWIAVHGFFYRNIKTIVAVLSAIGVLVGLFKTILSLKQPQR